LNEFILVEVIWSGFLGFGRDKC